MKKPSTQSEKLAKRNAEANRIRREIAPAIGSPYRIHEATEKRMKGETKEVDMDEATKRPWFMNETDSEYATKQAESHFEILGEEQDGLVIATTIGDCVPEERANAELIVRAVNGWDSEEALLARIEELKQCAQ